MHFVKDTKTERQDSVNVIDSSPNRKTDDDDTAQYPNINEYKSNDDSNIFLGKPWETTYLNLDATWTVGFHAIIHKKISTPRHTGTTKSSMSKLCFKKKLGCTEK